MILVDTNLLCRMPNRAHPHHGIARRSLQIFRSRGERLVIMPQNLHEFWSTATRRTGVPPIGGNGLGLSAGLADKWIEYFLKKLQLLSENDHVVQRWRSLVRGSNVLGNKSHDVRLVAAMEVYAIPAILTFNGADFRQFASIRVLDPHTV
jgi:predicted nucleic acid-binding protein